MEEGFEIPVTYKGKELLFPASLVSFGWTHRIEVDVYGTKVSFERDDNHEWRALVAPEDWEGHPHVDVHLLKAIGESIEEILKN
jgi:hypothetical protein